MKTLFTKAQAEAIVDAIESYTNQNCKVMRQGTINNLTAEQESPERQVLRELVADIEVLQASNPGSEPWEMKLADISILVDKAKEVLGD